MHIGTRSKKDESTENAGPENAGPHCTEWKMNDYTDMTS